MAVSPKKLNRFEFQKSGLSGMNESCTIVFYSYRLQDIPIYIKTSLVMAMTNVQSKLYTSALHVVEQLNSFSHLQL